MPHSSARKDDPCRWRMDRFSMTMPSVPSCLLYHWDWQFFDVFFFFNFEARWFGMVFGALNVCHSNLEQLVLKSNTGKREWDKSTIIQESWKCTWLLAMFDVQPLLTTCICRSSVQGLESCGSPLSEGIKKNIFLLILQSVEFSRTLRTDIFLYTEKLSYPFPLGRQGKVTTWSSHIMLLRNLSFPPNILAISVL